MYVTGIRCCLASKKEHSKSPTTNNTDINTNTKNASLKQVEAKDVKQEEASVKVETDAEVIEAEGSERECEETTLHVAIIERNHRHDRALEDAETILYFMTNKSKLETPPSPVSMIVVDI